LLERWRPKWRGLTRYLKRRERRRVWLKRLGGLDKIAPETQRIIIPPVERNPGHRRKIGLALPLAQPLLKHRCLAKARRGREERQWTC